MTLVDWGPIEIGDLPTYLGFTAAALAAWFAGRTWKQQKRLADAQIKQIQDELARNREDELRSQATKVSAWWEDRDHSRQYNQNWGTYIVLQNGSDEPVYGTVVTLVFVQGAAIHTGEEAPGTYEQGRRHVGVLPPGRYSVELPGGWGALGARPGAEIAFTDKNGKHWVRRATGPLERIPISAPKYYGMELPLEFHGLHSEK